MAPVVREIARHSLSPQELVLKRMLAGDRREEIFASKAELAQKLDPLPASLRQVFAPLGLDEGAAAPAPAPERAARKTQPPPAPPPPPPPRVPPAQAAAAIDTALRELDDAADSDGEPADATRPR
jgi:hypothetical protein